MTLIEWGAGGAAVWNTVSSILNIFFWFKTPEEWVAFAERYPRAADGIRLVRAWGIDPAKGLKAIQTLVEKRRPRTVPPPHFPSAFWHEPPAKRPTALPPDRQTPTQKDPFE